MEEIHRRNYRRKGNGFHYPDLMPAILEAEANLTPQNQITIPSSIRRALKLKGGKSRIRFQLTEAGKVEINLAQPATDEDAALGPFLTFLRATSKAIQSISGLFLRVS